MSLDSSHLDAARSERKVWLVKVPPSVAAVWRPLCLQALQSTVDENDVGGHTELGTIDITAAAAATSSNNPSASHAPTTTLTLKGPPSMIQGLPLTYNMNQVPSDPGASSIMAISLKQHAAPASSMQGSQAMEGVSFSHASIDGTIDSSFTLSVKATEGDQMDEAYRNMSKQRTLQAAEKSRTIKEYENNRENRVATLANRKIVLNEKRLLAKEQKNRLREDKRVRWDRPKAEAELFRLFERQEMWGVVELARHLDQPPQFLKEVLVDIAIIHKYGPLKDQWELKPEYKMK